VVFNSRQFPPSFSNIDGGIGGLNACQNRTPRSWPPLPQPLDMRAHTHKQGPAAVGVVFKVWFS